MENAQAIAEIKLVATELVETLNERQIGYSRAAELVNEPVLINFFHSLSDQSRIFSYQLLDFTGYKEPSDIGTSTLSAIFRAWMGIRPSLTGKEEKAVINDCILGEETAVKIFQAAVRSDLSDSIKSIIKAQLSELKYTLYQLVLKKESYQS